MQTLDPFTDMYTYQLPEFSNHICEYGVGLHNNHICVWLCSQNSGPCATAANLHFQRDLPHDIGSLINQMYHKSLNIDAHLILEHQ